MKTKKWILAALIFFSFGSTDLSARRSGIYILFEKSSVLGTDYTENKPISHFGMGFITDTNIFRDRVLNYRFTIGLDYFKYGHAEERLMEKDWIVETVEKKYLRFDQNHTLGFGVIRFPKFRLWFGPQFKGTLLFGDETGWGFGLGLLDVGANIYLNEGASLSIECGYHFQTNEFFDNVYQTEYGLETRFFSETSFVFKLSLIY